MLIFLFFPHSISSVHLSVIPLSCLLALSAASRGKIASVLTDEVNILQREVKSEGWRNNGVIKHCLSQVNPQLVFLLVLSYTVHLIHLEKSEKGAQTYILRVSFPSVLCHGHYSCLCGICIPVMGQ